MSAPLADKAVVPLRHLPDELVGLRAACRFNDFFFRRIRLAIGDIFANRSREQQRVLQHDRDLCPQSFLSDLANFAAIKCDRTRCRIIKTWHETEQCALAGSSAARQSNDLIRFDAQIDITQHISLGGVAKAYGLKCDRTFSG